MQWQPNLSNDTGKAKASPLPNFYSQTLPALRAFLREQGLKALHAQSIYSCLYRYPAKKLTDELPAYVSTCVQTAFKWQLPTIDMTQVSQIDGTVKMRVRLHDGLAIETVVICEKRRLTLCVSSQVGCAERCSFCQTGRMGLLRQLQTSEIVAQYLLARSWLVDNCDLLQKFTNAKSIANIVFMGMGEPLANLPALIDAIAILTDRYGLAVAMRKIAISTVGNPDALHQLLQAYPNIRVALSVHAADMRLRSKLMPANKKWSLQEVLALLQNRTQDFLVQYTLLAGVNDTLEDAQALACLLQGLPVKVNLLVYNPISGGSFHATPVHIVKKFQNCLFAHGLRTMIRYSKGNDIAAACGQLFQKTPAQHT